MVRRGLCGRNRWLDLVLYVLCVLLGALGVVVCVCVVCVCVGAWGGSVFGHVFGNAQPRPSLLLHLEGTNEPK